MASKIQVTSCEEGVFFFENGYCMKREIETLTPGGNKMAGRWVLRDSNGEFLDYHQYSNDLAERHDLDLYILVQSV